MHDTRTFVTHDFVFALRNIAAPCLLKCFPLLLIVSVTEGLLHGFTQDSLRFLAEPGRVNCIGEEITSLTIDMCD
ncbi:hypothetical protein AM586_28215 [Massilia sp. WG5]|nr:hypothetical protein AM586_28215 [Massilia sp. WG5]